MSSTVMVTGGSGFIGSYLLRQLAEEGHRVVNMDVREPGPEGRWWLHPVTDRIEFRRASVDDWSHVVAAVKESRPQAIVHTAAIVNPVLLAREPGLALRVNVQGTYHVLEAARLFGVERVVYFSSIGVLPAVQYEPIDANHPVILATEGPGSSFYGAAKLASEALCWSYHQSFGLDFITVRPSAVYGLGMQWPLFIKPMVENAVRGLPTRFEKGREFPRDYTHVLDLAQLTAKAVHTPPGRVKHRVFYGATGERLVTAGEVAEVVKRLIPGADIEIGSGLSEEDLLEIRYRGVLDIAPVREQLGYEPRFAHIEEGIQQYIEAYRQFLADTREEAARA